MTLSREELIRYSRQLSLKELGIDGQLRLKNARVLVAGAGGLGCPALQYLAAAGVGTIAIADFDVVALHNLQRQVIYSQTDIGKKKADVAAMKLSELNSALRIISFPEMLTQEFALRIFPEYDIVLDCTDNFEARYVINDACVVLNKPFVHGSVFRYEGQVSLFNAITREGIAGPTYRCLYPVPPRPGTAPSCEEAGVIGFLPGLIGTIQAGEAIKWITGIGETLSGRLLCINAMDLSMEIFHAARDEQKWKHLISRPEATTSEPV
jgi:adenylyltransferase/sulfurtransferase